MDKKYIHLPTRREFFREILYKNISIIAIQHSKNFLLTPLAIFPILLSEIHLSPSGQFPYTYKLTPRVEGSNYHTVWQKSPHSVLIFFVYINVAKFATSVSRFSPRCVVKFIIVYSTNYKTVWKSTEKKSVENQITTLSVVKIAINFSPCKGESTHLATTAGGLIDGHFHDISLGRSP